MWDCSNVICKNIELTCIQNVYELSVDNIYKEFVVTYSKAARSGTLVFRLLLGQS